MKTITGIALGVVGYAAWKLSEPGPGEPADVPSRFERLKKELVHATQQGREAGALRRAQMEAEFEAIFKKP